MLTLFVFNRAKWLITCGLSSSKDTRNFILFFCVFKYHFSEIFPSHWHFLRKTLTTKFQEICYFWKFVFALDLTTDRRNLILYCSRICWKMNCLASPHLYLYICFQFWILYRSNWINMPWNKFNWKHFIVKYKIHTKA